MNLKGNTILITGGSSGIGLELAKSLTEKGNIVIVCSRSHEKLRFAQSIVPEVHVFQCDISQLQECEKLYDWIEKNHPQCNVLINNAAIVHKTSFYEDSDIITKSDLEMRTNFMAPLILTKLFLPILERNKNSKLIYVTTGLVYVPKSAYPAYCATKAALHSFIQTLRLQLKGSAVKIIEVLMPAVDTPFHKGNPPKIAISPEKAVKEMTYRLEEGQSEIRIAGVRILYFLSRLAPVFAMKKINAV